MANASTLSTPIEAVRKRLSRAQVASDDCSFPELVWAHHLRQQEMQKTGSMRGEAEQEFRRRLAAFEKAEGRVLNAYWCTNEASAVAITEKRGWKGKEIRFHAATDWVSRDSPEIANVLHACETLAVRVREVLGGASERIAQQWILAAAGHLLGFVDQDGARPKSETARIVRRKRNELARIEDYYHRAGEKVARIVYFTGMVLGVLFVGAVGFGVIELLWWQTELNRGDEVTRNLAASYTFGALGAVMSVMTRMSASKEGTFNIDFEVGRSSLRSLGALRPCIGALSALIVYFALQGRIVTILPELENSFYVFAVAAFVAGFSERWANVIFGKAARVLTGDKDEEQAAAKSEAKPAH
ncbi:MAG TPA: hypothetical protein VE615_12625 [Gaiellaceae bacterium]|nr:hypothetical protein [Gaiellaceae bacterium]